MFLAGAAGNSQPLQRASLKLLGLICLIAGRGRSCTCSVGKSKRFQPKSEVKVQRSNRIGTKEKTAKQSVGKYRSVRPEETP